jgi:hypothetical protein
LREATLWNVERFFGWITSNDALAEATVRASVALA